MTDQRRGQATKERILEEACKVFAEKGYRDATHAEICRRATANIAAINYHFGSKESLYTQVFEYLADQVDTLYPLAPAAHPDVPVEERLRLFIDALLRRLFDPERLGCFHSIQMAEMFEPTGVLSEALERRLNRDRACLHHILQELLGPGAAQQQLLWCEMSIVSQCFMGPPGHHDRGPRVMFRINAQHVDELVEHIWRFSIAGVHAVGNTRHEEQDEGRERQK